MNKEKTAYRFDIVRSISLIKQKKVSMSYQTSQWWIIKWINDWKCDVNSYAAIWCPDEILYVCQNFKLKLYPIKNMISLFIKHWL
jgi:hypothetical protein